MIIPREFQVYLEILTTQRICVLRQYVPNYPAMKKNKDATTDLIAREARSRGISAQPVSTVAPDVLCLQRGSQREFVYYSCTDQLGHITFKLFFKKFLSGPLLKEAGFPVPDELVTSDSNGIKRFLKKHGRIVIKPLDSVWGQGVTPGITKIGQIPSALSLARSFNKAEKEREVVCQQHIDGTEYRILVINKQRVFVVERIPAHVSGDGLKTVRELIESQNASVREERKVITDKMVLQLLDEQGFTTKSVPPKNAKVFLKQVANAHAGGTVHDATEIIGKQARKIAVSIAKHFKAPVIGIDCITPDITKTIGYVIELNSTPDLTLHHYPTEGVARNPAGAIIDMLFPETSR